MRFYWVSILLVMLLVGCDHTENVTVSSTNKDSNQNIILRDSAIRMLQTGDLVFRLGNDMTSYLLSQMNQTDKSYSHCGIVAIESGKPVVYHAIGGEYNPDQKMRREAAEKWFSSTNNLSIGIARTDLDSVSLSKISNKIRLYYKEEKKFDMKFDLKTDDKLYCAEMIYKAVQSSINDSTYFPTTLMFDKIYIGVDNLGFNKHTSFICRLQYK